MGWLITLFETSLQSLPLVSIVMLVLLAGIVGLDVVSFPQAMISRPIVAATLGGWFVGEPVAGMTCGAVLECLAIESLPVGASRYPEWGTSSVVAGAVAAGHVTPGGALPEAGPFAVAVFTGIVASWLAGFSMVKHRQLVGRMVRKNLGRMAEGDREVVIGLHAFGMTADLLRGMLVGAVVIAFAWPLSDFVGSRWTVGENLSLAIVVTSVAAVAAAASWKDFHAFSGTRRLFLVSLAIGTLVVILGS